MRKTILTLMAIAVAAPTAVSAATLPVTAIGQTDRAVVLVADGDQSRHWRAYPGASHDRPHVQGGSSALQGSAPRTGFALQAPSSPSFGDVAPAFGAAPLEPPGQPVHRGGSVSNSHAGPAARTSR